MLTENEKMQQDFESDQRKVVEIYRTAKRLGKWAIALFGFVLLIISILLALKQLKE